MLGGGLARIRGPMGERIGPLWPGRTVTLWRGDKLSCVGSSSQVTNDHDAPASAVVRLAGLARSRARITEGIPVGYEEPTAVRSADAKQCVRSLIRPAVAHPK